MDRDTKASEMEEDRPMTVICTVGYQGLLAEELLALVAMNRVEVVVDVRETPQSRKAGFSRRRLEESLTAAGLQYVHVRELGNPAKWRRDLSLGLDFSQFAKRFQRLLDEKCSTLEEVYVEIAGKKACLLCFEEDPKTCHRSIVAERIRSMHPDNVKVEHIRHA